MDARQLRYFLAVVDHGGFVRAAEQLIIAQPSLSQTISTLERELGVPLFHRVGRKVVLSEAGQELVGPARLVLRDLEAARSSVDAVRGVRSGKLDLTTMPSPGIEPLTTMISRFTALYPRVTLNVEGAFTPEDVISSVQSGSCEIGLAGSREPLRVVGVDVMALEDQPLVLIVSPQSDRFGDVTTICREDLAGHRLIVSQQGSLMRWLVNDILAGGVACEIVAEVAHRTSILPLVMSGVGHAVLPSSWAPLAHRSGLRTVAIEPRSVLHVAILSRTSGLTPMAKAFIEVARAYAADVAQGPITSA